MRVVTLGQLGGAAAPLTSVAIFGTTRPTKGEVLTVLNRIAMMLPEPGETETELELAAGNWIKKIRNQMSDLESERDFVPAAVAMSVERLNNMVAIKTWRVYRHTYFWPAVGAVGLAGLGVGIWTWLRSR
jgi:hypothetical protein